MRFIKIMATAAVALSLVACQDAGPKQQIGTLLGAAVGGLAGSQVGKGKGQLVGIAVGTLLGSLAGSEVGKSLDRIDRMYMQKTTQRSLETVPSGKTSSWNNPDSGNSGSVTPLRTYQTAKGTHCRDFRQTVNAGGNSEADNGTACRQSDGTWQVVNN